MSDAPMMGEGQAFAAWADELMVILAKDVKVETEAGFPTGLRFGLSMELYDFWLRTKEQP